MVVTLTSPTVPFFAVKIIENVDCQIANRLLLIARTKHTKEINKHLG
jgi:hypothetical protein